MVYKMDTIFINSENSETSIPHELLLNLTDKMDLGRGEKCCILESWYLLHMEKYKIPR